jgi:hypothetical protein
MKIHKEEGNVRRANRTITPKEEGNVRRANRTITLKEEENAPRANRTITRKAAKGRLREAAGRLKGSLQGAARVTPLL